MGPGLRTSLWLCISTDSMLSTTNGVIKGSGSSGKKPRKSRGKGLRTNTGWYVDADDASLRHDPKWFLDLPSQISSSCASRRCYSNMTIVSSAVNDIQNVTKSNQYADHVRRDRGHASMAHQQMRLFRPFRTLFYRRRSLLQQPLPLRPHLWKIGQENIQDSHQYLLGKKATDHSASPR